MPTLPEPTQREREYADSLGAHLPRGEVWARPEGSTWQRLLLGLAGELSRAAGRALDLEREIDPRTTIELIPEWEEFLGLPDPCAGPAPDLLTRRAAVVAKLLDGGGATAAYLIALAARLGYLVTIHEHKPFRMGVGRMGDPLDGPGNPFFMGVGRMGDRLGPYNLWAGVFDVVAPEFTERWFRMGSTMGTPLRTIGNEILECAIRRAAPAHLLPHFTYSEPTTTRVETAYAPYHLGHTNPGLGLFVLDDHFKRLGLRSTSPNDCVPAAIWLFVETVGTQAAGAASYRIRVARSLASDAWQPDLTGGSVRWFFPDNAAPGWQRISLSAAPELLTPILEGEIIHVTVERQTGTIDSGHHAKIYGVKSRQPLQYTFRSDESGAAIRDEYLAQLYSASPADPAQPYAPVCGDNSSIEPIWWLETSQGAGFGNPFDVVEERQVYGADQGPDSLEISVRIPARLELDFWSLSMRGSGPNAALGGPQDDLYLTIRDAEGTVVLDQTPIVDRDGRLFQGRPHPFGYFLPIPRTLRRGERYLFSLSSPLSEGDSFSVNDSYLVTVVASTLDVAIWNGQGGVDAYVVAGGTVLSPRRQAGLLLQDRPPTPVAFVDEFNNRVTAPPASVTTQTLSVARDGDTVVFAGITRNTGLLSDGISGAELWARLIDLDSGDAPAGYSGDLILTGPLGMIPSLPQNDETTTSQWSFSLTMAAVPLHLAIQTGHALTPGDLSISGSGPSARLAGALVVDDQSPFELYPIPP